MNRSILIVICDFLLISLLVFSTPNLNHPGRRETQTRFKPQPLPTQADSKQDLVAVMRLALDDERHSREQLVGELSRTRGELGEREKQVQAVQAQLETREQQAQALQQQQAALQEQFATAQTNLSALQEQLHHRSNEAVLSQEKLAAMQAEMLKQQQQAAALQQQLNQLAATNQMVLAEKQQLSTKLQVAEAEKRSAGQQVAFMQQQVQAERQEKAKLADDVKTLATRSSELAKEVRDNRPLAPNTIFSDFLTNRVEATFDAFRSGLIDTHKRRATETVLVSDGTNNFALCHVQDTPLLFWNPGTDWEGLTGTLSRGGAQVPIRSVIFSLRDPRVVLVPVDQADVRRLGGKIYRTSSDPYKFQDAVLVGAREGYYGECKFEIDPTTPGYVKLDRDFLKGLFGKFNPSRGDLVFSKNDELLGVMANSTYCLMLQSFDGAARVTFGPDVRAQHTGGTLAQLYSMVSELPYKLQ
jgi:multidrug efflux pump subunit AcrA (membrane-fusion protein)